MVIRYVTNDSKFTVLRGAMKRDLDVVFSKSFSSDDYDQFVNRPIDGNTLQGMVEEEQNRQHGMDRDRAWASASTSEGSHKGRTRSHDSITENNLSPSLPQSTRDSRAAVESGTAGDLEMQTPRNASANIDSSVETTQHGDSDSDELVTATLLPAGQTVPHSAIEEPTLQRPEEESSFMQTLQASIYCLRCFAGDVSRDLGLQVHAARPLARSIHVPKSAHPDDLSAKQSVSRAWSDGEALTTVDR